jgi:hypothetical protein
MTKGYKIHKELFNELMSTTITLGYLTNKLYEEENLEERKDLVKRIDQKLKFYEKKFPNEPLNEMFLPFSVGLLKSYLKK